MASKVNKVPKEFEGLSTSSANDRALPVHYFPLKMVTDKKTEMYVKFAKVMVIAQGPYTDDGVDTCKRVDRVEELFKYTSSVLSDKSFMKHMKTTCSLENAEQFYDYFRYSSRKALEEGNNLLVIDSSMSNIEQNRYYAALAYKMQYVILVVPPVVTKTVNHFWPKESLAYRFKVEADTIVQPFNMFQHLFCAWYLHDIDSRELRNEASLYIQDCMEEISECRDMMHKICEPIFTRRDPKDTQEITLIDALREHYALTDERQDIAYCAVKMVGSSMKVMNEYFKKDYVQRNFGKMSKILIVGFIVSPFMIAARVKLTHHQKDLWEMEEEIDEAIVQQSSRIPVGPSDLLQQSRQDLPDVDVRLIASKSNQTLIYTGKTTHEPLEAIHRFAKGRACHIVLGKVPDAPSFHVDYDVQFALHRENKAFKSKADVPIEDLERCLVKRIGKYWYIYLKETISVDAFFASSVEPYPFDNPVK